MREVDLKLIELARTLQGKIVTNDFNLNKVAQLRGVDVLNINELANSLKPVVLPGEIMKVFILKEGKEYNQGVAYLDDGTMVVVDNARKMISKTIDIVVTSVLQTTAGKMIFGRYIESGVTVAGAGRRRLRSRRRAARRERPPAPARRRPAAANLRRKLKVQSLQSEVGTRPAFTLSLTLTPLNSAVTSRNSAGSSRISRAERSDLCQSLPDRHTDGSRTLPDCR